MERHENEYTWHKLPQRHNLHIFYCMVKRYRLLLCFYDYLNTKYACWIQDPVIVEEIENTPFLFSMYPFHKNTHYTKNPSKQTNKNGNPFDYFFKDI